MMRLPEDFGEFIELMISTNVRCVMIGGFAFSLYRNPRSTGGRLFQKFEANGHGR